MGVHGTAQLLPIITTRLHCRPHSLSIQIHYLLYVNYPMLNQMYSLSPLDSGVLQSGHLSPLLFSIFINRLSKALHHCQFLCYAHDIKLFMQINYLEDCLKLQNELDSFVVRFEKFFICHLILMFIRTRTPVKFFSQIHDSIIFSCNGFWVQTFQ